MTEFRVARSMGTVHEVTQGSLSIIFLRCGAYEHRGYAAQRRGSSSDVTCLWCLTGACRDP